MFIDISYLKYQNNMTVPDNQLDYKLSFYSRSWADIFKQGQCEDALYKNVSHLKDDNWKVGFLYKITGWHYGLHGDHVDVHRDMKNIRTERKSKYYISKIC